MNPAVVAYFLAAQAYFPYAIMFFFSVAMLAVGLGIKNQLAYMRATRSGSGQTMVRSGMLTAFIVLGSLSLNLLPVLAHH